MSPATNQGATPWQGMPLGASRLGGIRVSLCLLTGVVVSLIFLSYSHGVLVAATQDVSALSEEVSELSRRKSEAKKQASDEAMINQILEQAKSKGLGSKDWNERRMNIQSVTMHRERFNELMADVANTPRQVFGAEQFDVAVKDVAYGLFDEPPTADQGVVLTLRGTALFRSSQVKR